MLIDTHAHLNFNAFKDDAGKIIEKSLENNIFIINVGSQYSSSKRAVKIAEKYDKGVYAAVGLHPIHLIKRKTNSDNSEFSKNEFETNGEKFNYKRYLRLANKKKVVAIGEMGLDYHHFEKGDNIEKLKEKQKEVFLQGIKLANEIKKPLIIHCWDAYNDLEEILKNNPIKKKGVIHSFVGGYKTAKKFVNLGYMIGLNGIITYSDSFNRLIKELDLKSFVLETDCPYLSPLPFKNERNEPMRVKIIAEKISEIKKIDTSKISEITTQNAEKLFELRS